MSTKLFVRRSFAVLTLTVLCGLALSVSGCGNKDEAKKPDGAAQQETRKNKKDD